MLIRYNNLITLLLNLDHNNVLFAFKITTVPKNIISYSRKKLTEEG